MDCVADHPLNQKYLHSTKAPLRPSGGRGRDPPQREGEVGRAADYHVGPPHPALSPRPAGGEGKESVVGWSRTSATNPFSKTVEMRRGRSAPALRRQSARARSTAPRSTARCRRPRRTRELAQVYARLGAVEEAHAEFWSARSAAIGQRVPSAAAELADAGARLAGAPLRPGLRPADASTRSSSCDSGTYDSQPEAVAGGLPAAERSHARIIEALAAPLAGRRSAAATIGAAGRPASRAGGNALRAAVLGANDGLVLQSQPRDGRRRRGSCAARDPGDRSRRAGGRRLLDGDGRMAVGHHDARILSAADRDRGRRARAGARGGRGRAGADLPGQGPARGPGESAGASA